MNTLTLSQPDTASGGWDLVLDASGNLGITTGPQAVSQDVASACKLFAQDLYYDQTRGIPYRAQVLGLPYAPAILQAFLNAAALAVPTVVKAKTTITFAKPRRVTGSVEFIDQTGAALSAHF